MTDKQPALLMGYAVPAMQHDNANRNRPGVEGSIMSPLIEAQKRNIERLEALVEKLTKEKEMLKLRVWDLEDQLYRNNRRDDVRAKFDEESA